ncbi:MAG: DUF6339 family protein [Hyphomonadaceae bacterium]
MRYKVIDPSYASRCLESHFAPGETDVDGYVSEIGDGPLLDEDMVRDAYEKLVVLMKKVAPSEHTNLPKNKGGEFEALACVAFHETLKLPRYVAADHRFWLWLTFAWSGGDFAKLVDWRFQGKPDQKNYGVTSAASFREGFLARLWWRAEIGCQPGAKDPYAIARQGDQDIWRSHILRQRYGRNRSFARSFISTLYPKGKRTLSIREERELAKLTRARNAATAFELLDDNTRDAVLSELIGDAKGKAASEKSKEAA